MAKENEDEIFEYFVLNEEDATQYGTIAKIVLLPDSDILMGFNVWTAYYNNGDFQLYRQDDTEYCKLSEIRMAVRLELEEVKAGLME